MQTILIVDDDRFIAEALAGGLEQPGRELILCGGVEAPQLVIERLEDAVDVVRRRRAGE